VLLDIAEITSVPRDPQPMIPTCIAEFLLVEKTIPGFKIVNVEIVTAFLRNFLLSIIVFVGYFMSFFSGKRYM
jgi:hypothetical protein